MQDKFGGEGIIKDLDQEDDKFLYKGGFVNGLRHGEGEINYRNGNTYKGGFFKDVYHGFGESKNLEGSSYRGEWKKGKMNGIG